MEQKHSRRSLHWLEVTLAAGMFVAFSAISVVTHAQGQAEEQTTCERLLKNHITIWTQAGKIQTIRNYKEHARITWNALGLGSEGQNDSILAKLEELKSVVLFQVPDDQKTFNRYMRNGFLCDVFVFHAAQNGAHDPEQAFLHWIDGQLTSLEDANRGVIEDELVDDPGIQAALREIRTRLPEYHGVSTNEMFGRFFDDLIRRGLLSTVRHPLSMEHGFIDRYKENMLLALKDELLIAQRKRAMRFLADAYADTLQNIRVTPEGSLESDGEIQGRDTFASIFNRFEAYLLKRYSCDEVWAQDFINIKADFKAWLLQQGISRY